MTKLEKTKQCVLFLNEIMDEVPVVRTFAKSTMQFLNQRILFLSKEKNKQRLTGASYSIDFDKKPKFLSSKNSFNPVFHKTCKKCQRLFSTSFDSRNTCNVCNLE